MTLAAIVSASWWSFVITAWMALYALILIFLAIGVSRLPRSIPLPDCEKMPMRQIPCRLERIHVWKETGVRNVTVTAPNTRAGTLETASADFGPAVTATAITGDVVKIRHPDRLFVPVDVMIGERLGDL